ncbi:LLM class flavin-dependent oxidoreductase [Streptomyces sp. NPDC060194]|uniref:LLM class flavin-dependent oxidoreductase n=1 Tax=Streptomyces sp. NPDC060194 TaxID=3347069 RepID=UPI003660FE86
MPSAPRAPGAPHLGVALDSAGRYDADTYVRLARLAERGGLDFVTLGDSFSRPGPDALAVLARVAPATTRIGLVPTVTTTHTEPFHVQAAVATLDWVSRGRAGWQVDVSTTAAEARLFGRRPAAPAEEVWREAGEVADVAGRLWDSWDDDAEIRDESTGRFVDRDRLHHVDFEGATFRVRGPSIVPRPPQGRPVVVVDATGEHARAVAARHADVALVRADGPDGAGAVRAELRDRAADAGRDPDTLRVLAAVTVDLGNGERTHVPDLDPVHPVIAYERRGSAVVPRAGGSGAPYGGGLHYAGGPVGLADLIADWHGSGRVDGFHLTPLTPARDLERLVNGTVTLLRHRGLARTFYPGSTLREHLGLARPAGRYAGARVAGGAR